jgi:hypothetical protein
MQTDKQVAAIFAAIARNPEAFPAKPELRHKAAIDIVLAQFKDKTFSLPKLRSIAQELGRECVTAILETVPASVTSSLIAKLDKANKARSNEPDFAAPHLIALAYSEIEPAPATKAAKAAKSPKAKQEADPVVRTLHLSKALRKKS